MNQKPIQPPQPIPYPNNTLMQQLYRTPILLYRLGLGKLIGGVILIISTYGRKTGKVHRTPVEYYRHKGKIFVISGFDQRPDWYKNLESNPNVTLQRGAETLQAYARRPETDEEWQGVFQYLVGSPLTRTLYPGIIHQMEQPGVREQIKTWPVLTFDPTDQTCPSPLKPDLVWAWPIILLLAAVIIIAIWLIGRKAFCRK